jgi:hypothetical protein
VAWEEWAAWEEWEWAVWVVTISRWIDGAGPEPYGSPAL